MRKEVPNFPVNQKRSFQLLGKREKKLKIFLLKKARTILRLARKGLSQFWLVIFKPNRYGLVGVSRPESMGTATGSPEP